MREGGLSSWTARSEALVSLAETFRFLGMAEPGREARLTLCAACGVSPAELVAAPDALLGQGAARLEAFVERRAAGEPLSRIVGRREFWGGMITISPDVLDPRPESETIVEAAVTLLAERRGDSLRVLDLGVGSGALLCALLHEFRAAIGTGVDVSAAAARVALSNIESSGLAQRATIRVGDWTEYVDGPFDLIVSNPPYVPSIDIEKLPVEVRNYDPRLALDGGPDGLDAYRAILPASASLLSPGGWLIVEIGSGRAADVLALVAKAGFLECATRRDLSGVERVVTARSPRTGFGAPQRDAHPNELDALMNESPALN